MILSILPAACKDDLPASNNLVVQGYLYANRAFDSIKLVNAISSDKPFNSNPVINAKVVIKTAETSYELTGIQNHPGVYYYPGNNFIVRPDSNYTLTIAFNGQTITAITNIPAKSSHPKLSNDTIYTTNNVTSSNISSTYATLSWQSGTNYTFIILNYLEKDTVPNNLVSHENYVPFYLQQPLPDENVLSIQMSDFNYLGAYNIIVCQVNNDFTNLFNGLSGNGLVYASGNNITGGYGIFTGLYTDTIKLMVVKGN